jgi:hypothetical protein
MYVLTMPCVFDRPSDEWLLLTQHTVFLIFILSLSAFNGASFYFEVFAHR